MGRNWIMRYTGVVARGIITPIFKYGDDVIEGITESLIAAAENENIKFNDGDIVGVTGSACCKNAGAITQPASR